MAEYRHLPGHPQTHGQTRVHAGNDDIGLNGTGHGYGHMTEKGCCCGRVECEKQLALDGLERDLETAARLGQVCFIFLFIPLECDVLLFLFMSCMLFVFSCYIWLSQTRCIHPSIPSGHTAFGLIFAMNHSPLLSQCFPVCHG